MPARGDSPSQVTLEITRPEAAELPAPERSAPHVEVDAPFVFRASDSPVSSSTNLQAERLPMSRSTTQAPLLTTPEPPQEAKARPQTRGVFHKVRGFFSGLFK